MMSQDKQLVGYLVFKRIQVHNANAISSPITYGFPAVTGFLGAIHALSRKLQQHQTLGDFALNGVLIACHDCQVKAYRPSLYSDYTFNQTRNPIKRDGSTASIIEEGKCDLVVTLAVEVWAEDSLDLEDEQTQQALVQQTEQWIQQQRLAGGSVLSFKQENAVRYVPLEKAEQIKLDLAPAFVLMNAQPELIEITEILQKTNPAATALDALIEVATLHHVPLQGENGELLWQNVSYKSGRGWLVPMPVGFQGISACFDPELMQHSRNPEYRSQYVEAVYSLGKWIFPYRIDEIKQAFWHYCYDAQNQLYLIEQPH
ncbi:type I-F CRISPR-associated protein Csy2 [Pasteurella testudinis]|uniref:type I-F CRISPR-associated protein Csy2 n=1 Tax=Pasteurella testudinis TaxID=761 RepID=UPI00405A1E9B